ESPCREVYNDARGQGGLPGAAAGHGATPDEIGGVQGASGGAADPFLTFPLAGIVNPGEALGVVVDPIPTIVDEAVAVVVLPVGEEQEFGLDLEKLAIGCSVASGETGRSCGRSDVHEEFAVSRHRSLNDRADDRVFVANTTDPDLLADSEIPVPACGIIRL